METNAVIACDAGASLFSPVNLGNGHPSLERHRPRPRFRRPMGEASQRHAATPRRIPGKKTFQRIFGRKKAPVSFAPNFGKGKVGSQEDIPNIGNTSPETIALASISIDFQKDGRLSHLSWDSMGTEKGQRVEGSIWSEWQYLLEEVLPGKNIDEALNSILRLHETWRWRALRGWQVDLNRRLRSMASQVRTGNVPSPKLAFLQTYLELSLLAVRSVSVQEQA